MTTWSGVQIAVPELAQALERRFAVHRHKTLATLRKDGSPRISGTEVDISDGHVWLGGMHKSVKCLDLLRDARLALHGPTTDPEPQPAPGEPMDAKIGGKAVEITDEETLARFSDGAPPGPFHLFQVNVTEVVVLALGGNPADHIVIESWHEGTGYNRVERR